MQERDELVEDEGLYECECGTWIILSVLTIYAVSNIILCMNSLL